LRILTSNDDDHCQSNYVRYSFEQIQQKLETNDFLKFYRLIARIPKAFKDCLKENLLDIHFDIQDTTDTFVKKNYI
jgi:hypothetical protein